MATIVERKLKDGSSVYKVQVPVTDKGTGKVTVKSKTWRPDPTKTKRVNERALNEFALEFEKQAKEDMMIGLMDKDSMTVEAYSKIWLEYIGLNRSPTYAASCTSHIKEMNKWLGGYKLVELTPVIIQRYINKVKEEKLCKVQITSSNFDEILREKGVTKNRLSATDGLNRTTLAKVSRGENIEYGVAEKIA